MIEAVTTTPTQTGITASGDLLTTWHNHLAAQVRQGDLSGATAATYRAGVAKFVAWLAQRVGTVAAVRPEDVAAFKADQLESIRPGTSDTIKPGSVNVWLCGVRAFYAWAVESGRMPFNPAAQVRGAKRRGANLAHKRDALTQGEAARLLALPLSERDAALIALKLYAGVRDIEVSRADLADLRTKDGVKVLYVTGKGHSDADQFVKISARCEDALAPWLAKRGNAPGPLFTSASNRNLRGRMSLSAIRTAVKAAFRMAGITEATKTSHSTRHTAITNAIKHGATPLQVQAMARHAKLDTTMIYYHQESRLTNPAEDFIAYEGGGK